LLESKLPEHPGQKGIQLESEEVPEVQNENEKTYFKGKLFFGKLSIQLQSGSVDKERNRQIEGPTQRKDPQLRII
jgi:hypothetical protein